MPQISPSFQPNAVDFRLTVAMQYDNILAVHRIKINVSHIKMKDNGMARPKIARRLPVADRSVASARRNKA
ncbi:MAG: hypothetical protein Q7J76_10925 [Candidatus Brocadiaceae bacterium]|nr:hypothetical protein [Candidatus Brocadiaceae bacterium]